MVIAVDGAIQAPVAGSRLRRFLLILALGVAGWLLSVLFAATAIAAPHDPVTDPPATEEPVAEEPAAEEPVGEAPTEEAPVEEPTAVEPQPDSTQPDSSGSASTEAAVETAPEAEVMVAPEPEPEPAVAPEPRPTAQPSSGGGLLGGLLGVVTNLAGAVLDTTGTLLDPVVDPPSDPIVDVPELLPAPDGWTWGGGSSSGSAETVRAEPAAPTSYAVAPAAPAVPAPAAAVTQPTTRFVEPAAPRQPILPAPEPSDADQAQHGSGGDRLPGKVPAAPAAPAGPTASAGHDHSGGVRGLHGVLVARTTLEPGDAGFTTRSRAVNAAGRTAGLPAATPD